jgi:hypothetical protein
MTLDEILALPFVEKYELDDEPMDFDGLVELCDEFEEYETLAMDAYGGVGADGDSAFAFPVGEHDLEPYDTCEGEPVYMQTYMPVEILQESPIIFKVEDQGVTDYGVVQGTTLFVYRHKV